MRTSEARSVPGDSSRERRRGIRDSSVNSSSLRSENDSDPGTTHGMTEAPAFRTMSTPSAVNEDEVGDDDEEPQELYYPAFIDQV
jgi:hypothetical protein